MTPSKTLRLLSASLLLASGTALVTPVAAQEAAAVNAPQARRIVKQVVVQFKGGASLGEARVRAQMSTREGEVYTDENVEQDIRSLYASGSVDNVEISASDVAGGVKVTVVITGRGAVGEVVIRGNSIADSDRLIRESEIKVGDPVDEARLSKGQAAIRELYEKRGYPDVSVTYQTEPAAENGFTRVVYVIGEGARGLVRQINFEGNSSIPAKKLRAKRRRPCGVFGAARLAR
jgi:outer membrane protein insertion porin family